MLRPVVRTMHFMKRYGSLTDIKFQSRLCDVMWSVVCVVSLDFCLFLVPFAFIHASSFGLHDAFHEALLDP